MEIKQTYIKKSNNNLKVFILFEESNLKNTLKKNNIKSPKSVLSDFSGKEKDIIQFYNGNEIIILLGLGVKKELDIDKLGHIINHLKFLIKTIEKENIIYYLANGEVNFLKDQIQLISGMHYNQKKFVEDFFDAKMMKRKNNTKTNKNNTKTNKSTKKIIQLGKGKEKLKFKNIVFVSENHIKKLNHFILLIKSIDLVKDIGSAPANILTPPKFVNIIKEKAKDSGFNYEILGDKKLRKMGMNTLLSVSQGSRYSGYLVTISLRNVNKKEKPIVLVGKGITFDSGGTSLKRPQSMINMKTDMLGAGTILGYINYLATIKSRKNVIGLLAIAENMPGKFASRPGDVVKSYSGKTVEIVDTDAEGRLVMADALTYAHSFRPKLIMDIAGLTGQQSKVSGGLFATIMGNNEKKNKELIKISEKVNERVVEFPLYNENIEQTKSEIADFKNYNYKYKNGVIYAGAFLANFIEKGQDWIHMDIAGPESNKDGVTGFGVRLLNNYF